MAIYFAIYLANVFANILQIRKKRSVQWRGAPGGGMHKGVLIHSQLLVFGLVFYKNIMNYSAVDYLMVPL